MFETIIDAINTFLYSKLLIVILIGSGIYFTVRTGFHRYVYSKTPAAL